MFRITVIANEREAISSPGDVIHKGGMVKLLCRNRHTLGETAALSLAVTIGLK